MAPKRLPDHYFYFFTIPMVLSVFFQVCNAVYVRLNWTQPLCACPSRYRDPCSASLNSDDQHTTKLMTDKKSKVKHDLLLFVLESRSGNSLSTNYTLGKHLYNLMQ